MKKRGRKPSEKTVRARDLEAALKKRGSAKIIVSDRKGRVVEHEGVPPDWTRKDILDRLGIAEHLYVTAVYRDGTIHTVQTGAL